MNVRAMCCTDYTTIAFALRVERSGLCYGVGRREGAGYIQLLINKNSLGSQMELKYNDRRMVNILRYLLSAL
jgi:hypothetical protein